MQIEPDCLPWSLQETPQLVNEDSQLEAVSSTLRCCVSIRFYDSSVHWLLFSLIYVSVLETLGGQEDFLLVLRRVWHLFPPAGRQLPFPIAQIGSSAKVYLDVF